MCASSIAFTAAHPLQRRHNSRRVHVCRWHRAKFQAALPRALPSSVAAAAAVAIAASYSRRSVLPLPARKFLAPAALAALLVAVLLRPRHPGKETADDPPPRSVVLPDVGGSFGPVATPSQSAGAQSIFGNSRREWEISPQPFAASPNAPSDSVASDDSTAKAEPSGVYSYSYARSKKKPRSKPVSTGPESESSTSDHEPDSAQTPPSIFGNMRREFGHAESTGAYSAYTPLSSDDFLDDATDDWENSTPEGTKSTTTFEEESAPPRPLSTTSLIQAVVRAPMWLLSDVVLPIVDVAALLWYDFKVWALGWQERQSRTGLDRYFLQELTAKESVDKSNAVNGDREDILTEEERQVRQVQRAAEKVIGGVEGTVRRLLGDFL